MRTVDTAEFLDNVCELLHTGTSCVPVPVVGTSMTPFLHPGDTVYLSLLTRPPRRGDLLLYVRPGGRYILHRVIRVEKSSLWMQGDSQTQPEHILQEQIRAVAVQAVCRGACLRPGDRKWELYARGWTALAGIRNPILKIHGLLTDHRKNPVK